MDEGLEEAPRAEEVSIGDTHARIFSQTVFRGTLVGGAENTYVDHTGVMIWPGTTSYTHRRLHTSFVVLQEHTPCVGFFCATLHCWLLSLYSSLAAA
jgi:hypothetical protein